MAKRRMLSQELIYDEEFNSLSIEAQNLFIRMLTVSDDYGILPGNAYTLNTLTNPPKKISRRLEYHLKEIVNKGMGVMFSYEDKQYFMFKRTSFDRINSYVIGKRTKSEYLKLDKEFIESERFQEILGNSREMFPTSIISKKNKVESNKKGGVGGKHELWKWIEANAPRVHQMKEPLTDDECNKLIKDYPAEQVKKMFLAMHNYRKLLSNSINANLTVRNWLRRDLETTAKGKSNGHLPSIVQQSEWMSFIGNPKLSKAEREELQDKYKLNKERKVFELQ